jgi:photosystem II stability/assembly factor-like uncharacterized protein
MTRVLCHTTRTRKSLRVVGAICGLVALASALLLARGVPSAFAISSGPLDFGAPALVDSGAPYVDSDSLVSLSCPSTNLCVGASVGFDEQQIVSSTDPTGGSSADWSIVPTSSFGGSAAGLDLGGVACVTQNGAPYCVADGSTAGGPGVVLTSTDPSGGAGSWTTATASPPDSLNGAPSCVAGGSRPLCLVSENNEASGNAALYASADPAASWSATPVLSLNANNYDSIQGTACLSTTLCLVGTYLGDVYTSQDPTSAWSSTPAATGLYALYSLSCPTTSFCLAAGTDSSGNGEIATTTDPADGKSATWTLSSPPDTSLWSVSCFPDPGLAAPHAFCLGEGAANDEVDASTDGGASWAQETTRETYTSGFAEALACPERGPDNLLCIDGTGGGAVDYSNNADASPASSASWSTPLLVLSGASPVNLFPQSCPSSSLCVASDATGRILTSTDPGGGAAAWSSSLADPDGNGIADLACPTTSLCIAIDFRNDVLQSTDPAGGGGTWSAVGSIDAPNSSFYDLECIPGTETCLVSDGEGEIFRTVDGGSSWSGPSASISGGGVLTGISCPSSAFCLAVDSTGDAMRSTNEGVSWSASPYDDPSVFPTMHFTEALACAPATEFCVAVDSAGYVLTTANAGVSWSAPSASDDMSPASGGLSCPSASLCVELDSGGGLVTSSNPASGGSTWSAPSASFANGDLTCVAGTQLCLASDQAGDVIATTGWPAGPAPQSAPPAPAAGPAPSAVVPEPSAITAASLGEWHLSGTSASALLTCAGSSGASCTITVSVGVRETLKGGKVIAVSAKAKGKPRISNRAITVGSTTVTLSAGQSRTVMVALNVAGERLLARDHAVAAKLTAREGSAVLDTQTVTFKAPPARQKHK